MSAPLYSGAPWIASLTCPGTATGGSGSGTQGPPGPTGPAGPAGAAGTDGVNAFTATTGNYVQPAINSSVLVSVADSSWMAVGQVVYVDGGGYYTVFNKPNSTSVSLVNLGYDGNAAPGVTVNSTADVSPAGLSGVANGGIYAGTQAELDAQNPPGPALWILTDSVPQYQLVPIP